MSAPTEKHIRDAYLAVMDAKEECLTQGWLVGTGRALDVVDRHVARAIAQAEQDGRTFGRQEGMRRAAEIARGELVEIYEDSPDIDIECNNLVRRVADDILSKSGEPDQ